MTKILNVYFFDDTKTLSSENLERLEHHFQSLLFMTNALLEQIDTQKEPLYKSIVKMNQLLVSTRKLKQTFLQRQELLVEGSVRLKAKRVNQELLEFKNKPSKKETKTMYTEKVQESHQTINEQIARVLELKSELKQVVLNLNKSLEGVGFELRELEGIKDDHS